MNEVSANVPRTIGQRALRAYADPAGTALERLYRDDAVLFSPLAGAVRGRDAIGAYLADLREGFPDLRLALHDEFTSADGARACIRLRLEWTNSGPFRGNAPTGVRGDVVETHSLRIQDGQVAEHITGVSSFQMPKLFLVDFGLDFPRDVPDPAPEILSSSPGEAPASDPSSSIARRFGDAFGRRDVDLLDELYAENVALYTPLGWPVKGREALKAFALEFHAANPGMRVALHDEFYSADGTRACWRIRLDYHNTEPFYGNPATGDAGVMTETHALRVADGRIVEHFVGDNSFHMPYQELVLWKMPFPDRTPDPHPEIDAVLARPSETAV